MKKLNKEATDIDSARNNFANLLKKWNKKSHFHHEDRSHHYNSQSFASQTDYDDEYDVGSPVQKTKRIKTSSRK